MVIFAGIRAIIAPLKKFHQAPAPSRPVFASTEWNHHGHAIGIAFVVVENSALRILFLA